MCVPLFFLAPCKRKEESQPAIVTEHSNAPKKPRLVFTDLQRRTLQAIFKVLYLFNSNEMVFFFFNNIEKRLNSRFNVMNKLITTVQLLH